MNVNVNVNLIPVAPIGSTRTEFGEMLRCPRCWRDVLPLQHPGALSRTDNATEICSTCGTVEALADFYARGAPRLDPNVHWPIASPMDPKHEAVKRQALDD